MQQIVLGRSGLKVSVAGIGTGGPSRIGTRTGASQEHAVGILHRAHELGVTYFDTSQTGDTEEVIAKAFKGRRDEVVISTKFRIRDANGDLLTRPDLRAGLDRSLERLDSEYADLYYVHSLGLDDYDYCVAELVPELDRLRDSGKIRAFGVSEQGSDPGHRMLTRALEDECWSVLMVTLNLFNQTAIDHVLPKAVQTGTATVVMAAARGMFSNRVRFAERVRTLCNEGALREDLVDLDDALGFAFGDGGAVSMADASYRFARDTAGTGAVLVGTGSFEHLEANIGSFEARPLPGSVYAQMRDVFGSLCLPAPPD